MRGSRSVFNSITGPIPESRQEEDELEEDAMLETLRRDAGRPSIPLGDSVMGSVPPRRKICRNPPNLPLRPLVLPRAASISEAVVTSKGRETHDPERRGIAVAPGGSGGNGFSSRFLPVILIASTSTKSPSSCASIPEHDPLRWRDTGPTVTDVDSSYIDTGLGLAAGRCDMGSNSDERTRLASFNSPISAALVVLS
jgi:hypothetical protein